MTARKRDVILIKYLVINYRYISSQWGLMYCANALTCVCVSACASRERVRVAREWSARARDQVIYVVDVLQLISKIIYIYMCATRMDTAVRECV